MLGYVNVWIGREVLLRESEISRINDHGEVGAQTIVQPPSPAIHLDQSLDRAVVVEGFGGVGLLQRAFVQVDGERTEGRDVFPLLADEERMPPTLRCRVYRSEDAGAGWRPLEAGLPPDPYHAAVLRDAMCSDGGEPAGIYFGTRAGEVFASVDDGDTWTALATHLLDVLTVRAALIP